MDNAVEELERAKCLKCDNEDEFEILNGGLVSSYYYVKIYTLHIFLNSIEPNSKWSEILEILCSAKELESLPLRLNEEDVLKGYFTEISHKPKSPNFSDPGLKANIIIQSVIFFGFI